jgi:hypothetical protein
VENATALDEYLHRSLECFHSDEDILLVRVCLGTFGPPLAEL